MTTQHDHHETVRTADDDDDDAGSVTVRVPARAAALLEAYLEESVSPRAIRVQRLFFRALAVIPLALIAFGVIDWARFPGSDAWPFDATMIGGGALFIVAVFWVRGQTLRVWRRAGLV